MDLHAVLEQPLVLDPRYRVIVSVGIRIALPEGFEAQIRPRSGLAIKHGLAMVNSPGTIDSDYRGVIRVVLINLGLEPITINRGDRIAQMVIAPVVRAEWEEVDDADLPETLGGRRLRPHECGSCLIAGILVRL